MKFESFPQKNEESELKPLEAPLGYETFTTKPMTRRQVLNGFKKLLYADVFAAGIGIGYLDDVRREKQKELESSTMEDLPEEEVIDSEFRENETSVETMEGTSEERLEIGSLEYKKIKPELSYEEKIPLPVFENLNMPDRVGRYGAETHDGKILRTLRFKNIADVVEESTGEDLLPNARGDGGFGLAHMQGSVAAEFGLKTFCGCNSLVCNTSRGCKNESGKYENHAKHLATLMREKADDKKELVEADERLHWILNLDAVGRMLASYMSGPKLKGKLSDLGPFRRSIARYSGSVNYRSYWEDLTRNMKDLNDSNVVEGIAENFDALNPDFKIDGKPANFSDYMKAFQAQAENYGLSEYKKLPKYNPKNSDKVLESYKDFM